MLDIDRDHSSPNQSSRNGAQIVMLVGHATVGPYQASLNWLCNPASQVSTHYLIRKDGHTAQLVPDDKAAWHAGKSFWRGLNSDQIQRGSIGIELENANDGKDPYPPSQVGAFTELAVMLLHLHPAITADMVVRHLDIAIPAGRKTDPAGFSWAEWKAGLFLTNPLTTHTITGANRAYHCGSGFANYYASEDGLWSLGFPLGDEQQGVGGDGRACTFMPFERGVLKYVQGEGVRPALLSEAEARGWVL